MGGSVVAFIAISGPSSISTSFEHLSPLSPSPDWVATPLSPLGDNPHVVNSLSRTAHIYRAHAFQNRAKLRHFQGKYSEADNLYGAAVRMLQGLLGESHLDLGLALTSYAQLLREMDRLEEAQQKEALAARIFASNHSHRDLQQCQF